MYSCVFLIARAAPKLPTRHLVLSARPALPTPDPSSESSEGSSNTEYKNPPRPTYPKEVLKHRFMPYGSITGTAEEQMDVDDDTSPTNPSNQDKVESNPVEGGKSKKRKSERAEGTAEPRKSRKSNTPISAVPATLVVMSRYRLPRLDHHTEGGRGWWTRHLSRVPFILVRTAVRHANSSCKLG